MKIDIKVVAKAKKNTVKEENGILKVTVMAPAVDGKANKAVLKLLAKYYDVSPGRKEITKGLKSRNKTISIGGIT